MHTKRIKTCHPKCLRNIVKNIVKYLYFKRNFSIHIYEIKEITVTNICSTYLLIIQNNE